MIFTTMNLPCKKCGAVNVLDQPYIYHAGFADLGFAYNKAGRLTLIWDLYDPEYLRIIGSPKPCQLTREQRRRFEAALPPSPAGDPWSLTSSARCVSCKSKLSSPMSKTVHILVFPGSVLATLTKGGLRAFLSQMIT